MSLASEFRRLAFSLSAISVNIDSLISTLDDLADRVAALEVAAGVVAGRSSSPPPPPFSQSPPSPPSSRADPHGPLGHVDSTNYSGTVYFLAREGPAHEPTFIVTNLPCTCRVTGNSKRSAGAAAYTHTCRR